MIRGRRVGKMRPMDAKHDIEIFRAGRHVDMHGREFDITAEHVAATARCYDPAKHEAPVVIGHPKTNAPAYGWVTGLRADGDLLLASVQQMDPAFASAVQAGRYKKRSAAFLLPDSAGNPVPGSYYLNHLGFLGAQSPAVKGLRDVQFAAGTDVAEFASDRRWAFRGVAEMLRRLRDWIVQRESIEEADKILPTWQIDSLHEAAMPDSDLEAVGPSFASPEAPAVDPAIAAREQAIAQREAEQLAREQAIAEREAQQLARDQAQLAQAQTAHRETVAAFADGLVSAGRLLPREAGVVTELLVVLHEQPAVAFAAADGGEPQMQAPADALSALLSELPVRVDYKEKSRGDVLPAVAAFSSPPGTFVDPSRLELLARARAWQAEHPESSLVEAVNAVSN